jgi:hypothetical protein
VVRLLAVIELIALRFIRMQNRIRVETRVLLLEVRQAVSLVAAAVVA